MVTMEMGYENGLNFSEPYVRTTQLYLCSFATVNHKKLSTDLNNL